MFTDNLFQATTSPSETRYAELERVEAAARISGADTDESYDLD